MFEQKDGSGRKPRQIQLDVLAWIEKHINLGRVLGINAPTGSGKSFIVESLLIEYPGSVALLPTNILMDQYVATYPDRNYVKGKAHYDCKEHPGFSCFDSQELFNSSCPECEYTINKKRALDGESTVFNPMSYYYFKRANKSFFPPVVVVDEAHKLGDMATLLTDISFRKSKYDYPEISNEIQLSTWLNSVLEDILAKLRTNKGKTRDVLIRDKQKIENILWCLAIEPQNFTYYTEKRSYYKTVDEYLVIRSINPPKQIIRELLESKKTVLTSATLLQHKIWELGYNDPFYLDLESPIAAENRPILYRPASVDLTYKTSAKLVADYIKSILAQYPGLNTVIHVSYGWSEKLKLMFPGCFFNTAETKDETLETFKKVGGVWFASGCSEGIDLPGDLCKLIIIPIIHRENIADPVVVKRLAMHRGSQKYDLNSISTIIQQAGRGTRGEQDSCITVIGDRKLPLLITKNRPFTPKSFLKAIKWRLEE